MTKVEGIKRRFRISARVVAVVFIAIAIAFFIYVSRKKVVEIEDEVAKIESEIATKTVTYDNLSTLYNNMEYYEDETVRLMAEAEEILLDFPTYMYLEDKILYEDEMENIELVSYNIGDSFHYSTTGYGGESSYTDSESGDYVYLDLYSIPLSFNYVGVDYQTMKELALYGMDSKQRFIINSLSIQYDSETGLLSGSVSCETFFINGQSTPYSFPEEIAKLVDIGDRVGDLFGTFEEREREKAEEESEEETGEIEEETRETVEEKETDREETGEGEEEEEGEGEGEKENP